MFTLPKLLRKPLPPKTQHKPLPLKKEKIQSAITNEVSKQQDLLKPCPSKITTTEIEKNVILGKFPKRKRQSRIYIKNLLLKQHVKRHRDAASKMFLKKYPKFCVLFSNRKDNYSDPFCLPTYNSVKDENISEKSSLQRKTTNYFLDGALEKTSVMSSEISTPTSSHLRHSSILLKPDLKRVTTPDSIYMPLIYSRFVNENQPVCKEGKMNWYDKLQMTHGTMTRQNFSFDALSAASARKPYRQYVLEFSKKEEEKPDIRDSSLVGKLISLPESLLEMTESEKELIVYGEGYYKDLLSPDDNPKLNLAKIAVIRCHEHGRNALSFKGFFIERCPNLSILIRQLVYLNLAFNSLPIFPPEVLVLINLQVLIMRNNPIREIPSDIEKLKHLEVFVISFNLLTSLPNGLFALSKLEFLDISYNEITSLPNEIKNLSNLNNLNLEGNELTSLPPGILKISPDIFNIENNFIHPLFWKENSKNDAQSLKDLALVSFVQNQLWKFYEVLPSEIKQQLITSNVCDYCRGPLYGKGLRVIRSFDVFNIQLLPILFNVCSSRCYRFTKRDPNILDLLTK
ncbi:leucine-rich repeat-containing protein 63 [Vombatus ursinus]|uniref:Leucine rich repeat containing 63 n=1 Tax=Vombatus ursinus TaxID=29139 RepID=A0A4X2M397_VOMUR|nr:leucine-rich repeat-containing protein 63 [Vombatus ursinus]XP_027703938.1 leucine-rich repeat-containing protein 63 [Vombatus ursinus]XP_027703939.1 leucine-rich repeat-containing protein 63 [Vombatus ursinus]XP_027703940.1 leucine-rich repeat-containing protein 63 [Vombatus ursinus]